MSSIKARSFEDLNSLATASRLNKREGISENIKLYLENRLPDFLMSIDWSKADKDYEFIPWASGNSYLDLWKERHLENGLYEGKMPAEGILALGFEMGCPEEEQAMQEKWMDTLHAACCDIFTEQNVLSAMFHQSSEGYPHAHILVYPADAEGYLNASKWIADTDRDKNGKEGTGP